MTLRLNRLYALSQLKLRPIHLALIAVSLTACTQGAGCSAESDYLFPPKDKIQSAVQIRVTEPGFVFMGEQVTPLIKESLPEQLNSCLPGDEGSVAGVIDWRYCNQEQCSNGETGCEIAINIGEVELNAIEPSVARVSVTLDELALRFDVAADPVVDCDIAIDGPGFPVQLDVELTTPEPARNLNLLVREATYSLSDLTIRLEGNGGTLSSLCEILDGTFNLPFIRDLVFDLIEGAIDNVLIFGLQAAVNQIICLPCEGDADPQCLMEGGSCVLGACLKPDLSCVPRPLGLEGRDDVGAQLSSFSPNLSAELGYFLNPGSYAQTEENGLSLGVITGVNAALNRCAPPAPQPNVTEPPRLDALRSNFTPEGAPYDVGIGISETILKHALWSFHQSGLMCLSITTDQVAQLSPATFTLLLPRLAEVTREGQALAISLSPQVPPEALIGENRLSPPDSSGQRTLEDPLITLDWPELWIDFHAFMEDRWSRLFSLKLHLLLPVGISFDPSGAIVPLIGDLNSALTDVEVVNSELLLDDTSRITMLLPTLLRPLLSVALANPIALPDLLGMRLVPNDGSIRGMSQGEEDFITLFADLAAQPMDQMMGEMMGEGKEKSAERVERAEARAQLAARLSRAEARWLDQVGGFTRASVLEVFNPAVEDYLGPKRGDKPSVTLSLDVDRSEVSRLGLTEDEQARFEYSWRVDEGPWRPYTPTSTLTISDPELLVPGLHNIDVRARLIGDPLSLDPSPSRVEVELSAHSSALIGRADPQAAEVAASSGCACDQRAGARAARSPLWALLIALFIALKPRREAGPGAGVRRMGARALLPFLCLLISLGCEDKKKRPPVTEVCDASLCGPNQVCVDNTCQVPLCEGDASCAALDCGDAGAQCNERGLCECVDTPLCPEGCAEGETCCYATNTCEPPPPACRGEGQPECPAGYELAPRQRGTVNPNSCALEGEVCECIEATPLPIGAIGRYSDLSAVSGVAWVSAYSDDYGDLIVGKGNPSEGLSWMWVDGVPTEAPVVASPSGPRAGVEEQGADVGAYTSIGVSPQGIVHVAYLDRDRARLKYAVADTRLEELSWRIYTLDAEVEVEGWIELALSSTGLPFIVYRALPAEGTSEVRLLSATSPYPELSAWGQAQVLHSSETDPELMSLSYPEGTGLFNSVALSATGELAVAWYDRSAGNLMVARGQPGQLGAPEVLAGWGHDVRTGDMGASVEVAFDPQGALHLCYQDGTTDSLRYLSPDLDRDELIDDGLRLDVGDRARALHVVGDDCGVHFDGRGRVVILYQDATAHEAIVARRDDSGSWLRQSIRSPSEGGRASGFYVRGSQQGSALWVSHFYYDHQIDPPSDSLELFATPFP